MARWPGSKKWVLDLRLNSRIERLRIPAIIVGATLGERGDDNHNQNNDATENNRRSVLNGHKVSSVTMKTCIWMLLYSAKGTEPCHLLLGPTMNGMMCGVTRSDTSTRSKRKQVFKNTRCSSAAEITQGLFEHVNVSILAVHLFVTGSDAVSR